MFQLICLDYMSNNIKNRTPLDFKTMLDKCTRRRRIVKIGVKLGLNSFLEGIGISLYNNREINENRAIKTIIGIFFEREGYQKTKEWLRPFFTENIKRHDNRMLHGHNTICENNASNIFNNQDYLDCILSDNPYSPTLNKLSLIGEHILRLLLSLELIEVEKEEVELFKKQDQETSNIKIAKLHNELFQSVNSTKTLTNDNRLKGIQVKALYGSLLLDSSFIDCQKLYKRTNKK